MLHEEARHPLSSICHITGRRKGKGLEVPCKYKYYYGFYSKLSGKQNTDGFLNFFKFFPSLTTILPRIMAGLE